MVERETNGDDAAPEPADDEDDTWTLEQSQELIKELRKYQGKPAELTPDEQRLTREECHLLWRREWEAMMASAKTKDEERNRSAHRVNIVSLWLLTVIPLLSFTGAICLWVLTDMDRLSEQYAPGQNKFNYLTLAGFMLVLTVVGYFNLRAARLGTERAIRLAAIADRSLELFMTGFAWLAGGAALVAIGFLLYGWLHGDFPRAPFIIISMLTMFIFMVAIWPIVTWIDKTDTKKVASMLIAFGVAVAAHEAAILHFYLSTKVHEASVGDLIVWLVFTVPAFPLFLGIIVALKRLRALRAAHPPRAH
jgi:hypothetical protein